MKKIKKIKLFINNDDKSSVIARTLINDLTNNGFLMDDNDFDLGISIGGDGCFLGMIRDSSFNKDAYYIGVNVGTLGFLQEIDINNTKDFVERLSTNDYKIEEVNTLSAIVYTRNDKKEYRCLNEFVIRKDDLSVLKNNIKIDNELLENFTGDGLLVSTATGSTAYNMSFGGSIIYNTLKAYIVTPIAPINNKVYNTLTNSIVIPNEKKVTLEFNNENLYLMVDGKNKILNNVMKIEIMISLNTIKCLRMHDFHFIKVLNNKIIGR